MNKGKNIKTKGRYPHLIVCCMECEHSILHRYVDSPILAACKAQPILSNGTFPYEIEVARVLHKCILYKKSTEKKEILQLSRRTA